MKVEVKVIIDEGQASVAFKGIWTRRLVDVTYKNMLLKLPAHVASLRERVIIPENIIEERKVE